jgi:hypothetical protein
MHVDHKEKSLSRRRPRRHGYALVLVMVFVVLFTAVLGVAWRRVASALRVEHISTVRSLSDEGSIQALAAAMKVLETRLYYDTATSSIKFDGSTDSEKTYWKSYDTSDGTKYYKITFTRTGALDGREWSVNVTVISADDAAAIAVQLPANPP